MGNWQTGGNGAGGALSLNPKLRLVLFPGETDEQTSLGAVTYGHIYVVGGQGESYKVAAGPRAGSGDRGGHTRTPTPAGDYTLHAQEHVTTVNWPMSSIPWGAVLTLNSDDATNDVSYTIDGGPPVQVVGPKGGSMATANKLFFDRSTAAQKKEFTQNGQFTEAQVLANWDYWGPRVGGASKDTSLATPWNQNDFGVWGWRLLSGGAATAFFIHTTPEDEQAAAAGTDRPLVNSHGCIHVRPADRDDMMSKGYLVKGMKLKVMPYGQVGPP
jgi:hypothetical protein